MTLGPAMKETSWGSDPLHIQRSTLPPLLKNSAEDVLEKAACNRQPGRHMQRLACNLMHTAAALTSS